MAPGEHLAAGAATGYVFQLEQAMLKLLPHALADEDAAVAVEVYDDVSFHRGDGPPKEVVQVHHSLNSIRDLTDTSAKTWRTLAIWADAWVSLDADETREMTLLTTQRARPGSALEALTPRGWNLDHAAETLSVIAADPNQAVSTAADRATFNALNPAIQRELLSRVTVVDGTPGAADIRPQLETRLKGSHESRFISALADSVEGWWWSRVVRALYDGRPVEASEMRTAIDEARRSLSDRGLPIRGLDTFDDGDVPTVEREIAIFITCLRAIEATNVLLDNAVIDFMQASAHRSYWLRRLLIGPAELSQYDSSLLVEWDLRCERILDALKDRADAAERTSAGRKLYYELQLDMNAPLRPEVPDRFVQRGSFHTLADAERLAWHPDAVEPFRDALRKRDTVK